ncbi:MAG: EamA family transporter [Haloferacaceae archaeon]
MPRRYLLLSLLAFAAYSLVAPLLKIAMQTIPSVPAVFMSNAVMLVLVGAVALYHGDPVARYLRHPMTPYIVVWGITLAVGLLSYYRALTLGPVSIVVPIYGLFIPLSSVVGIVAFDETLTLRKGAGIAAAVVAIALMSL